MAALFAATYPERTSALVLYAAYARRAWAPDFPWGRTEEATQAFFETTERDYGGVADMQARMPGLANDVQAQQAFARFRRLSASPGAALALAKMNADIDVRDILPSIRVPTLVIQRRGDRVTDPRNGRYLAEHIPGARYLELDGDDHAPVAGDSEAILNTIEEFLTGTHHVAEPDRVLATLLFTDIVGSTERAASLGDRDWRDLLDAHNRAIRRELARYRGAEVKTTGDGFLATFDGPARAVRCASAIVQAARSVGLEVRSGLHTGEIDLLSDDVGGIAVHIGARVAALAGPGEVLVSSTVKDLVAGAGLTFEARGAHTLKGVPDEWRLFSVVQG